MKNTLIDQSHQAASFIQGVWPEVLAKAKHVLHTMFGEIDEVILCGCGDSHHAAVGLETAFDLWSQRIVRAAPAMFAGRYLVPRLRGRANRCLVIGISASGEIARTIEAIELAKEAGAYTLAFTTNPNSSLGRMADGCISATCPSFTGPGLLSYLASLLMGYATCAHLSEEKQRAELLSCMEEVPSIIGSWVASEEEIGSTFAQGIGREDGCVVIAGGSLFGSALFSAAKVIESAGVYAWAQELEEWAHLEYFCDPANMPTWFLSAEGRTESRERELIDAAKVIGRRIQVSRWQGKDGWSLGTREALAPLGLWAGPTVMAATLSEKLGEKAFRGFGGGRSSVEGGGASRIRSSQRLQKLRDLEI